MSTTLPSPVTPFPAPARFATRAEMRMLARALRTRDRRRNIDATLYRFEQFMNVHAHTPIVGFAAVTVTTIVVAVMCAR